MKWNVLSTGKRRQDTFSELQRNLEKFFDDSLPWSIDDMRSYGFSPAVDVTENRKGMHIRAELPGMEQKDINLSILDGILTLKGEKKHEEEHKDGEATVKESSYGYFSRSFRLPQGADAKRIKARYKNGVLKIDIPANETKEAKTKQIAINVK